MTNTLVKAVTEAGEFTVPKKDYAELIMAAYDRNHQYRKDYGRKPTAKPFTEA